MRHAHLLVAVFVASTACGTKATIDAVDALASDLAPAQDAALADAEWPDVDAGIDTLICTPGETQCTPPDTLRTCATDGEHWTFTPCTGQKLCIDGHCLPIVCKPGEKVCDGPLHILQCNALGTAQSQIGACDPCPTNANPCAGGKCAQCLPQVCTPGATTCIGAANVGVCKADGTAYVGQACNDGDACTLDSCDLPGTCTATAKSCDDGKAETLDGCDPSVGCVHLWTATAAWPCLSNVDCDDGDACTFDTCVGGSPGSLGTCKWGNTCVCQVSANIGCGDTVSGSNTGGGATAAVKAWECLDGTVYPQFGKELVYGFTANCTGPATITLAYSAAAAVNLFLLDGSQDCSPYACLSHALGSSSQAKLVTNVVAGASYYIAMDTSAGVATVFTLDVSCACP